jgi:serine/threonine protein kinase
LEQLPTKGAEADIYVVQAEGIRSVLKLYRHRLEPKLEVLNRIAEISRNYSRHFVVFKDTGFDENTGRWFELQEYVPLGSLKEIPRDRKCSPPFVASLLPELATAIHCLHLNNIIHCDIKPANVLVRSLDPLDAVLTDFGISSLLASDMSQKMTSLKGTPMYWAPEAFSRAIGRPCDWWGLGMILLELLAGEHPLEGLTDSQIIHKLTIGNVEVPDSLGPEWIPPVKGLLTKDDRYRWGYGEITRWLAGDRGVPVHYQEPLSSGANFSGAGAGSGKNVNEKNPFRFEGKEYFTTEDLARAFAVRESPWFSGMNYLRYIRQWLESNMLFDEAVELGNMISKLTSEQALFRFVHTNAKCPFSLMGKLVDADNLHLFLTRVIRREASISESRLVTLLGNGQLSSFYEEYVSLGREKDPLLHRLLLFMDRKTPLEQWTYFEAMGNPDAYIWPKDAGLDDIKKSSEKSLEENLEILEKMGVCPLKRDALEKLEKTYVLPSSLFYALGAVSTYASTVERLETWRQQDLLLLRESMHDAALYENLSLEDYAQAARVRCLGHTPAILERLDFLIDALAVFPCPRNALEAEIVMRTALRLGTLREKKISSIDSLFIAKTAGLLQRRRGVEKDWQARYAVAGVAGGLFSGFARFLTGTGSDLFFRFFFIMAPMLAIVLFLGKAGMLPTATQEGRRGNVNRGHPVVVLVGLAFYMIVAASGRLLLSSPYIFSSAVGVLLGGGVCFGLDWFAQARNERAVVDACASYCTQTADPDGEDLYNLRRRWS